MGGVSGRKVGIKGPMSCEQERCEWEVCRPGLVNCKKRNRPHTQTHNKNNTTHDTTRTTPHTTTRRPPPRTCEL